jgi:hypothetical protein
VLLLTFTIGILNFCLGYALAVYLGYGPPGLREAWAVMGGSLPPPADHAADMAADPTGFLAPPEA